MNVVNGVFGWCPGQWLSSVDKNMIKAIEEVAHRITLEKCINLQQDLAILTNRLNTIELLIGHSIVKTEVKEELKSEGQYNWTDETNNAIETLVKEKKILNTIIHDDLVDEIKKENDLEKLSSKCDGKSLGPRLDVQNFQEEQLYQNDELKINHKDQSSTKTTHNTIPCFSSRLRSYKCIKCSYFTRTRSCLTALMKSVHAKIKDFPCNECNMAFSRRQHLLVHIKLVHSKIKEHESSGCSLALTQKDDFSEDRIRSQKIDFSQYLDNHDKPVHATIRDNPCNECDVAFSMIADLNKHKKAVHDKVKDKHCDQCNAAFSQNKNLTTHITQVHARIKQTR